MPEKNIHEGHRKRVREEFLQHGFNEFTPPHKVLELLLFYCVKRSDTNPLAHKLLEQYKTLSGVLDAPVSELIQFDGITENSAVLLKMILPVARFYLMEKQLQKTDFHNIEEIGRFLVSKYIGLTEERLGILSLDNYGRMLSFDIIAKGDISSVGVSPRSIIKTALDTKASAIVMCHNHPGGVALPSESDADITILAADALKLIDVSLLDHIIVTDTDFVSMRQSEKFCQIF